MPLMREPNEESLRVLELFRWFRGGTVSAFAQTEFGICRLLSCMRNKGTFAAGLETLPWKAIERSKKFREAFRTNALLQQHTELADDICDTFELIIAPRNYLAHGFARIDMASRVIQMRKFQPISGNTWNEDRWDIPFEKMEPWGQQIDSLAQTTIGLCIQVSEEHDLGF